MNGSGDNLGSQNTNQMPNAKGNSSPWEEELDFVDEPKKSEPKIIGTLDNEAPKIESKPFNVPKEIDEKVGQKVPAASFIDQPVPKPNNISPKFENKSNLESQPKVNAAPNLNPKPAAPSLAAAPIKQNTRQSEVAPEFDFDFIFDTPPSNKTTDIPEAGSQQKSAAIPVNTSNVPKPISNLQPSAAVANKTAERGMDQSSNSIIGTRPIENKPKMPASSASAFSGNSISENKIDRPQSPIIKPQDIVSQPNSKAAVKPVKKESSGSTGFFKRPIVVFGLPCLLFIFSLIFLTEFGIISLGIEKIYGAIGIERLWGGLPKSTEGGLIYSAIEMQKNPNFKTGGTLQIKIDNSIKSDLITPISFSKNSTYASRDTSLSPYQKALKTVSDDYYYYETDVSVADDTASSDSVSSSTPSVDSSVSSSSQSGTDSTSKEDASTEKTGFSQLEASVSLKSSSNGISTALNFLRDGIPSEINLLSAEKNLWVKTSDNIKYDNNSKTNTWVKYELDVEKNVGQGFFNYSPDNGFSVEGKRAGNEKIDGVRCYRYNIESLEIGKSLAPIGIDSDMLQSATGDIWIGVKDKLIRRAKLKLTTPVSSAISLIEVELNFSEFGISNSIDVPALEQSALSAGLANNSIEGDDRRKNDVDDILKALKDYKEDNGKYPISNELLKLSQSGNIIEKALVPKYLNSLPFDPKITEGWYYAYKSDGDKCSVSARLEDPDDEDGQYVNDILLYLKYNNE